jgi:hypothetical protein
MEESIWLKHVHWKKEDVGKIRAEILAKLAPKNSKYQEEIHQV